MILLNLYKMYNPVIIFTSASKTVGKQRCFKPSGLWPYCRATGTKCRAQTLIKGEQLQYITLWVMVNLQFQLGLI